jgi:hypothetical protein
VRFIRGPSTLFFCQVLCAEATCGPLHVRDAIANVTAALRWPLEIEDSAANCDAEGSANNCGCYGLGSFPSPAAALRIPAGVAGACRPRRGTSERR